MWRLHRYLFSSTATIALASVGILVLLLVTGNIFLDLFDKIDEGTVGSDILVHLIPDLVLYTISLAMPVGTLVGILVVVGRLSSSSELTALKASGISLWRVAAPLVLFCLLGTAFTGWINASVAPSARASYRDVLLNAVRADPLRVIIPKRYVHDFSGYVVYVDEKQGGLIRGVWIWELDDEERPVRLLRADAGTLSYDLERDALLLRLENGFVELRDEDNPNDLSDPQPSLFFDHLPIELPLADVLGERKGTRLRVANLPLDQKQAHRRQLQRRIAAEDDPELRAGLEQQLMEVQFKIQSGFANAFSVLALGILAIPLGVKASRRETSANLFIAIGLTLVYYVTTVIIGWFEDRPEFRPDLLIWLPNFLAQGVAAWLFVRVNRH